MEEPAAAGEPAATEPIALSRAGRRLTRRTLFAAAGGTLLLGTFGRGAWAAPHGERRLLLYNPHTDERFDDLYWADGNYVPGALRQVDWLMRDYHQGKVAPIDAALLDLLHRLSQRLELTQPFTVLSGYRTAATNRLLRSEGMGAAAHSEHLFAKAADIRVEGVRLSHLRHAALSLAEGGVGTYWHDDFVHVDVGPVRSW